MEPVANHITSENTGNILQYRDLVKKDPPVWTNSVCNKLGRFPQGWKAHAGPDTIKFIFHKYKPNGISATYVRAVCDILPQK